MWFYVVFFLILAFFALLQCNALSNNFAVDRGSNLYWRSMFIFFTLIIGLRDEVGGDWFIYLPRIDYALMMSLSEILIEREPGYNFLNWIGSRGFGGIYFVNTICALIFSLGLFNFCKILPRPWLALSVAVSYLVIVVAMGYTRQGVAIGLGMLGIVALQEKKIWSFIFYISVAATFHRTAIILLPFAFFGKSGRRVINIILVFFTMFFLYIYSLQDNLDNMLKGYLEAEMESSGAMIRVSMNALAGSLFILFERYFISMTDAQRIFWRWMSFASIFFLVLLWQSPSSTTIDRLALYFIPIQLVTFSHLPDLGKSLSLRRVFVISIVTYNALVLLIWLFFAANRQFWIPYKFYPWEILWQ